MGTDSVLRTPGEALKIAFLVGSSSADHCASIAKLSSLKGVKTVAVLVDTGAPSMRVRRRNLARNIRRQGLSYAFYRALSALRHKLDNWSSNIVPQHEVETLLAAAFPERSLENLAKRYGFPVFRAGNLNGEEAIRRLREAGADLGVVLGTRILKRAVFAVPRLGSVNLHKGKVPEYRGTPPGFWELYEGAPTAGITVHFVDDGLDTGDVVGAAEVAIHAKETPESLKAKLDAKGIEVLASVLEQVRDGRVVRQPQPLSDRPARTKPTRRDVIELARRLPHWRRLPDGREVLKTLLWLGIYHSGLFGLLRWTRRSKSRGAILLYHRVNDVSEDVLTTSTRRFAEHLVTLRRFYKPVSTEAMIEAIASRAPLQSTSVAVHFDDCYRDVHDSAAPLLEAAGMPATAFVSSGFVDTDRAFRHDLDKYPHRFANLGLRELTQLPAAGVEVGAHTVNHVDLGQVSLADARVEVVESRAQLEAMLGRPVLLFSFPFGGYRNIREEVRQMVAAAGYKALFSAHGGFVGPDTELMDVPRFGISSEQSPLDLLMEVEGIKGWLRYS